MLKEWILICSTLAMCIPAARAQDLAPASGDPTLIGWWMMDETSGTKAADSSGLGNDGTLKNGPTWIKGFKGNALRFDGRNDYVAIDKLKYNSRGNAAVTVATWIRTTNPGDQYIISYDRDAYWQMVINGGSADDGQVAFLITTDAGLATIHTSARVDDGNWHHVAAVFDSGRLTLYVDGVANATATSGRSFGTGVTRFGFLGIGSQADKFDGTKTGSGYLTGDLDDMRIYNRAVPKTEIEQIALRGPSNDMSDSPTAVGEVDKLAFDTSKATPDGQGLYITSANLWYLYTPSGPGQATVSLAGSQFDTMLVVYRGNQPNPGQDRVVVFNDDYDGLTSQVAFDAVAGQTYLIEVGGFDSLSGQGLLTITCQGAAPGEFDLGDAPDGQNSFGKRMTAYSVSGQASVKGNFPTVFNKRAGQPCGPIHVDPLAVAHLGPAVTLEIEADKGVDEDTTNNLNPARDESDKDGADDGVVLPLNLPQGEFATFDYVVSVIEPNQELWVNVWLDWNRDGDWDDDGTTNPEMVVNNRKVSEWAVQNQYLYGLSIGTQKISAPAFLAWHPEKGPEQIWMRITLSEKPWKGGAAPGVLGNGGSGPVDGYAIGETEDYLITPGTVCSLCQDRNGDGKVDFDDLIELMYEWMNSCAQ